MSTVSTFGAFTMAKLGIYASHKAMQVTGNNITNINTKGYTRQTLDQTSLYVGGADRYASKWDPKIGSGVLVTGVSQIRSPYLDIRYRTGNSRVGKDEKTLDGLNGLSQIFDEVGKGEGDEGIFEADFQELIEQLTHYNTSGAGEDTFDTVFKGSVSQVLSDFNTYAGKLEDLYKNTKDQLQADVKTVNGLLSDIRSLNNSIRKAEIHGSNALELRDTRNLKIDELSKFIRINVIYEEEDVGCGVLVEKLTIRLDSADESTLNHDGMLLVDGKWATQLIVPDVNVPEKHPEPECKGLFDVTLDALRDVRGRPKMLVDGKPAVFASDPVMEKPQAGGGTLTIGDYTAQVSAPDPAKSDAENVEMQLREFCKAYNTDPANTKFRAAISLEKNSVIFTASESTPTPTPPAAVDTTAVTPLTADGDLTIGGYTAAIKVDPTAADPLADQLKKFMDAYNSDPKNSPNRAYLDGTEMKFDGKPLETAGNLNINGYSVFIKNAENMTREQQLAAFRDIYNADPDIDPDYATLSADGTQLIFTTERPGPLSTNEFPAQQGIRLVSNGITPVPDPDNIETELTDTDLFGALQATREMLTEEGEFASSEDIIRDKCATSKRGIPYYQKIWDAMARKFAETLNDANSLEDANGDLKRNPDGSYIVNPQNYYMTSGDRAYLTNAAGQYVDKNGNVIVQNEDGTFFIQDKNGAYVDTAGDPIQADPSGTYTYQVNADGKFTDKDGKVVEKNPDSDSYMTYKTAPNPNDNGAQYYVDKDGNPISKVGEKLTADNLAKCVEKGDPRVVVADRRAQGDPRVITGYTYVDADGNEVKPNGTPVNESDFTVYKTFQTQKNPDGTTATDANGNPIYIDNDGKVITPDPVDGYTVFSKNDAGDYLDKYGHIIVDNKDGTYSLKDEDGKYYDTQGREIKPNADGTYTGNKTDAYGREVDKNGNVIVKNDDGTYFLRNADNEYVDANGTVIKPDADGTYNIYQTDPNDPTVFVDKDGNALTPNPDDGGYKTYKTETGDDGKEYYLDSNGDRIGEVGNTPEEDLAKRVVTGDMRVVAGDRRTVTADPYVKVDRRAVEGDQRFVIGDKRVITGDIRTVREQYKGGVLFSNSGDNDDPTNITAKNISISHSWSNNSVHVMQSREDSELDQSTANSNIRHMVSIVKDNNFTYKLSDMDDAFKPGNVDGNSDVDYFKGTFADMLTKIDSQLGQDTSETQQRLANDTASLVEIEVDRDSVSGVDLNDEAISMMQYNKSYSAACRYLTTLDEMIDKLINGTAI